MTLGLRAQPTHVISMGILCVWFAIRDRFKHGVAIGYQVGTRPP